MLSVLSSYVFLLLKCHATQNTQRSIWQSSTLSFLPPFPTMCLGELGATGMPLQGAKAPGNSSLFGSRKEGQSDGPHWLSLSSVEGHHMTIQKRPPCLPRMCSESHKFRVISMAEFYVYLFKAQKNKTRQSPVFPALLTCLSVVSCKNPNLEGISGWTLNCLSTSSWSNTALGFINSYL